MATEDGVRGPTRVASGDVWRLTKSLFLVASLLFLVNIALGFVNALTTDALPRWQFLTHLHAGTMGWITLANVTFAIWLFTGDRSVSERYVSRVRLLGWLTVAAVVGLVASFALGFSQGGDFLSLLAVFAPAAALLVWATFAFAVTQLRQQPTVRTVHVLVTAGLFVGSLGVTMGTLLGVENAVGGVLPIPYEPAVSIHQAFIDYYLLLFASAIVEWFVLGCDAGPVTRTGALQAAIGVVPPVLVPVFMLSLAGSDAMGPALLLTVLGGFLAFGITFVVRVGRHALRAGPFGAGAQPWFFFGALWLAGYVLLFMPTGVIPKGLVVNYHIEFLGMMTNCLLGVLSVRTRAADDVHSRVEPAAAWLLNGGLLVFFALEITMQVRHGVIVMGLGVLLAVGTMMRRLRDGRTAEPPRERVEGSIAE